MLHISVSILYPSITLSLAVSPRKRFQIFRLSDFQIFRLPDFQIFRFTDLQIFRFSDFRIFGFSDFWIFGLWDFWIFEFWQIRARMQRGGHGCSVEGTWVLRTREPAGPDVGLVRTETTKNQIASRFDFYDY